MYSALDYGERLARERESEPGQSRSQPATLHGTYTGSLPHQIHTNKQPDTYALQNRQNTQVFTNCLRYTSTTTHESKASIKEITAKQDTQSNTVAANIGPCCSFVGG